VSARGRIWLLVGAVALLAAGGTVGATLLTRTVPPKPPGPPELDLDLGLRTDAEAVALRRALQLYVDGKPAAARAIFSRYDSLEARIGAAVSDWPDGFERLSALAHQHPRSSLAHLELGLAAFQLDRFAEAEREWRKARRLQPDTSYSLRAEDLLHPRYFQGHPPFSPSFPAPAELAKLSPQRQFALLAARARKPDAHAKILFGVELLRLGRTVSAEREFRSAAALAPSDPDARAAEAVGLFDKAHPSRAFSQLGPLVKLFPKAPVVRYHLGLMLLWLGEARAGRVQLQHVVADGPSPYLGAARRLLAKIPAK
jgi:tetratricopeptide (TPR) repeat protein